MAHWHYVFFFCCVIYLFFTSILIFCKGFLLRRDTLNLNTTCGASIDNISSCTNSPRYEKAVILVVDGLRDDFAFYQHKPAENLPYINQLGILEELLTSKPNNSWLARFVANPPTTTMQRISGLMTGSLPTFLDVSSNFDSYAIAEDNLIDQLIKSGKKITLLGDDTWNSLFPNR